MSAMAEGLEAELSCSICLDVYKDPRLLTCGHNFCHTCLLRVWENQDSNLQRYSCPECRAVFEHYPVTQRNIKLSNIIERIQASKEPASNDSSAGPALRSHTSDATCEKMCSEVCANHEKPWEFFCKKHKACLCRSCLEEHKTHRYQHLEEAKVSMDTLKGNIRKLEDSQKQMLNLVEWLQEASSRLACDRAKLREQLTQLFEDIQNTLTTEKEVLLALIDNDKEKCLKLLESHHKEVEKKREEVAKLIKEANRLVDKEISNKDFMDHIDLVMERMLKVDKNIPRCRLDKQELDRTVISQLTRDSQAAVRNISKGIRDKLRQGKGMLMETQCMIPPKPLSTFTPKPPVAPKPIKSILLKLSKPEATDFTLDPNTAHCNISISDDLLSAQWVPHSLTRPTHPERFRLHPQVLCSQGLSRGVHIWQVEVGGTRRWEVGVTCKNRNQAWVDTCISWALRWDGRQLQAFEEHKRYSNSKIRSIKQAPGLLQVHLDCGQKTLSFFTAEEGLLHSFSIKPSGPIFPGFYLDESFVKIKKQDNLQ